MVSPIGETSLITQISTNILKCTKDLREAKEVVISAAFNDFDEFLMSYLNDVPGGGLFLETNRILPLGSKVNLHFTLRSSRVPILEGKGEIISIEREDQENVGGIVVKFFSLDDKSKKLLTRLVKNFL